MLAIPLALSAVSIAAIIVAFLLVLDRRDARAQAEREAHRREIAVLCQRIQAPREAVTEHAIGVPPDAPPPVHFDDDEGYWAATESKEQLAERMLREELQQRVTAGDDRGGPA